MDKDTDSLISNSELIVLVVSSMIGVGVLSLPNEVIKYAKQDGWFSCIIGSIYPFYITLITSYFCKKYPKQNILTLSKKCFGKFLGTFFNLIFASYFMFMACGISSGISNVLKIYMIFFLNNYKILIVFYLIPAYIAYKGIKTLSRLSEMIFYITLPVFLIPIATLKEGTILNLMPVFNSGIINIIKGTKNTFFSYAGIEFILILYPYLQDTKNFVRNSSKGIIVISIIYTWFTFITIYYLGIDIIPKFIWSSITISESIIIPVINNFRYIFMVMWSAIMFRTMAIYYYSFTYCLSEITKKIKRKDYVLLTYPLFFYLSSKVGIPTLRSNFLDKVTPLYVIFTIIYITTIVLILIIKRDDQYEKKLEN